MTNLLYLVNFYGTPPLSFLKRYLEESGRASVTVIKLPSVRSMKRRFISDPLLIDYDGCETALKIDVPFPFPYAFLALFQYLLNVYFLFRLLFKAKIKRFDICIGDANYNGALTFLLKKLGKTNLAVFMNGDVLPDYRVKGALYYTPNVGKSLHLVYFGETLLIKFQWLLRRVGYHCDLVWYPTERIKSWDEKYRLFPKKSVVTSCGVLDAAQVKRNLQVDKSLNRICYIGQLNEFAGMSMALEVVKKISTKKADIEFVIIGGGTTAIDKYRKIVEELGIERNVKFFGYIPSNEEALALMSHCALGLALFKPVENNVSLYTEPTKVKDYIKAGLPVVITRGGPDVKNDLEKYHAGILVDFNKDKIAEDIYQVLSNESEYEELRKGVAKFGEYFDYHERFRKLWDKVSGL